MPQKKRTRGRVVFYVSERQGKERKKGEERCAIKGVRERERVSEKKKERECVCEKERKKERERMNER